MTTSGGDDDRARRVGELFDELVELAPGARAERLAALRAQDAGLAAGVERLLEADALAGGFLSAPVHALAPRSLESAAERDGAPSAVAPGDVIGTWRLLAPLGAGGMGEVWEVERAEGDFEQKAALKLLRRGLDSEDMLRRFASERQILARLRHPSIAHLYDGGIAPDGRPFYVMERIAGQPLATAAAAQKLSVEARLRLFLTVCDAVEAAHRALVVHRDLKPSNVLVTEAGGVKLLDFGIAKVLAGAEEDGGNTRAWERVMTPAYAAPEQVLGEPITTATDVYALGVLLYELLTGQLPHRRAATSPLALAEELTRETTERPSSAVLRADPTTQREALAEDERQRRSRRLRGDLDWIVLRALAREPERRYASAAALAADLRRHLEGHPVEARPDSLAYRTSKLVRRHKVGFAAAALATLGLLGGTAVALWQAQAARAEARHAERESARARVEAERARVEAEHARREATRSDRIASFLQTMILEANPAARAESREPTVMDVVRSGAAHIDDGLAGEPELQARMGIFFGDLFINLDEPEESRRLVERAFAIATKSPGVEERTIADAYGSLAHVRYEERKLDESERLYRTGLEHLSRRMREAPGDVSAADLEITLRGLLANTLHDLGRTDEAIAEAEHSAVGAERLHGPEHRDVLVLLANLGRMQEEAGRLADAERTLRRSLDLHRKVYGPTDGRIYFVGSALADVMLERGNASAAYAIYEEALAAARTGFGPDDKHVASANVSVAEALLAQGRLDEAERVAGEALALAERLADDRTAARAQHALGRLAELRQRPADAARHFASGRDAAIRHYGPDHHAPIDFAIHVLLARAQAGEPASVLDELDALVARQREMAGSPADVVFALHAHGEVLALAGRVPEGVARLRESVALGEKELGAERLQTVEADLELGRLLAAGPDEASRAEGRRRLASAIQRCERLGRGWMPTVASARRLLTPI